MHLRSEQVAVGSEISDQFYSLSGGNATYVQRSILPNRPTYGQVPPSLSQGGLMILIMLVFVVISTVSHDLQLGCRLYHHMPMDHMPMFISLHPTWLLHQYYGHRVSYLRCFCVYSTCTYIDYCHISVLSW